MVETITARRLAEMQDSGESYTLVDTRPEDSFEAWHVHGAKNFPFGPEEEMDDADRQRFEAVVANGAPVVAICAKGISSKQFGERLAAQSGYHDVRVVEGGMEAWSQLYEVTSVPTADGDLDVLQVQRRAKGCLGYVVGSEAAGEAVVVDTTRNTDRFRRAAEDAGYEITRVFDTHVHADHVSGGRELAAELGVPYHLGVRARERGIEYEYDALERNETVAVGDHELKAVFAPGHTTEMVNYLVDDEALLTGDTLFVASTGRTELEFEEDAGAEGARMLYDSLHGSVLSQYDGVTVLPGHVSVTADGVWRHGRPGDPVSTTVADARTGIDVLDLEREAFVEHMVNNVPEKPPNYETVIDVNRGKQAVEDGEAVELEMGPNNCSA